MMTTPKWPLTPRLLIQIRPDILCSLRIADIQPKLQKIPQKNYYFTIRSRYSLHGKHKWHYLATLDTKKIITNFVYGQSLSQFHSDITVHIKFSAKTNFRQWVGESWIKPLACLLVGNHYRLGLSLTIWGLYHLSRIACAPFGPYQLVMALATISLSVLHLHSSNINTVDLLNYCTVVGPW